MRRVIGLGFLLALTNGCEQADQSFEEAALDLSNAPESLYCGWSPGTPPQIALEVIRPENQDRGECWRIEAKDRATELPGTDACDVKGGPKVWPGGSVINVWSKAVGAEQTTAWLEAIVECPPVAP